jgi:phosphatidate cytidylyltransferase
MLKTRLLVAALLLPIGIAAIYFGGFPYYALIALILFLAAWEFVTLFQSGGLKPSRPLVLAGVVLLVIGRVWNGFESMPWILSLMVLASLTWHVIAYERGSSQAGLDFAVTVASIVYLGWIGAYLISIRQLPHGEWWMFVVLPSVWAADTGAYSIGSRFGRRKFSPRVSPHKTWEGYLSGVVAGTLAGALLAFVWQTFAVPGSPILPWAGAVIGFIVSSVTVIGDLGVSVFKRQFGFKDSGNLLPGHGGMLDRIDSWLWGGVIGYYTVSVILILS